MTSKNDVFRKLVKDKKLNKSRYTKNIEKETLFAYSNCFYIPNTFLWETQILIKTIGPYQ